MKPYSIIRKCPACDELITTPVCAHCGFGQALAQPTPAQGSVSDTPETDKEVYVLYTSCDEYVECIQPDFARTLERERDALKKENKILSERLTETIKVGLRQEALIVRKDEVLTIALGIAWQVRDQFTFGTKNYETIHAALLSPTISSSLVEDRDSCILFLQSLSKKVNNPEHELSITNFLKTLQGK